ncbi:MAG: MBL fold metallo-hydrolase [Candidatus Omnitrophica bacterium]|nr:MBL fold metallo-hydrolase [Candidatus Omnitrophota bacterium]MDD5500663.1 MBL fold metallo-hydrolase [Candidatus Omnitrophota bacterium]
MAGVNKNKSMFIKFLGTAGARFVTFRQLRASGGIWICLGDTNVLVDPGPGSIVRCLECLPKMDPEKLDALILTHRHLDHANDINIMIESMTCGGSCRKGAVFCPSDCLGDHPVILPHAARLPGRVQVIKPGRKYKAGDFAFTVSARHLHPCETYGLKFNMGKVTVGLVSDTRYFDGLADFYRTDVIILPVVFRRARQGIDHMSLEDASELIGRIRPKKAVLTHFGMDMLKARPSCQAKRISERLGVEVIAAHDGMRLDF